MFYMLTEKQFRILRRFTTLAHATLPDDGARTGESIDIIYFLSCKTFFRIPHIPRISQALLARNFGPSGQSSPDVPLAPTKRSA